MKKNAINENNISNKKNIKLNYFKSKSPPLKYKIIKTNINTKGENIKNENESINNNSNLNKEIYIDKNECLIKNGKESKKGKDIIDKINSKKQYNIDQNLINNQKDKYFINKNTENDLYNENLKVIQNNKGINLINNEENKKPEDISDYLNIDEKEYVNNYIIKNKKITNEAIEEVEEAKEMSGLKQPSDILSPQSNKNKSKIIIKNIKPLKNIVIKTKNHKNSNLKNDNSKNKSIKISLIKKNKKKEEYSPPLKLITPVIPHMDNSVRNNNIKSGKFNKMNLKTDNNIQNYSNKLIFKSNHNLFGSPNSKIKHFILGLKNSNENTNKSNQRYKKILINKEDRNISNIGKRFKSNINWKSIRENKNILIANTNLNENSKYKQSAKTTPNLKDLFNKKRYKKNKKVFDHSLTQLNTSITRKIKMEVKKPLTGYIYNNKLKLFNSKSSEKKEKWIKKENSKKNNFKLISEQKVKKIKKNNKAANNVSFTSINLDKVNEQIGKIKNIDEKYHKLIQNYSNKWTE